MLPNITCIKCRVVLLTIAVFMMDASAMATTWTYSDGVITDGNWTLNCTYDVGQPTITIGTVATVAESGILDLREMSVTDGTTSTLITRISFSANWENNVAIRALYADCVENLPRLMGNTTLEEVSVANQLLTSIPGYVFFNCSNLTSDIADIVTPEATSIGQNAFKGSKVTGKLTLTNVASLGDRAFELTCISDVDVASDAITTIGSAFYQMTTLTNATLSCPNLEELSGTFAYCGANLKTISLNCPKLATIGANTFRNNNELSVDIASLCPQTVVSIGDYAFYGSSVTGKLVLSNVSLIGASAFNASKLQEIEVAGSLETIQGFYNNTVLTNATFDCPVATNIAAGAFRYSGALKSLTLNCPALTSVGADAFGNTGRPMSLSIKNGPWCSSGQDLTATLLDGILAIQGAVSSASHSVIYADQEQWSGYTSKPTDAETAFKPEKTYGVYVSSGDVRKAFFVQPEWARHAGFKLIVR